MRNAQTGLFVALALLSTACLKISPDGGPVQANTGAGGQPIHISSSFLGAGTVVNFNLSGSGASTATLSYQGSSVSYIQLPGSGTADLTLTATQPGSVTVTGTLNHGTLSAHTSVITFVTPAGTCAALPDISTFLTAQSDRFLVDPADVSVGHPYKGARLPNTMDQHQGAHVQYDNTTNYWPHGGTAPANYPTIYAVADGVIHHIDNYFPVGSNYRYGFSLQFATKAGAVQNFGYSIEPMIDPQDPTFYLPYVNVVDGQCVHKGDVLGHLYVPPNAGIGTHIHFHIQGENDGSSHSFKAPAIFTPQVVSDFHAHFGGFGFLQDGTPIPATMGYMLADYENPFGTGAFDCLDPQAGACP